MNPSNKTRQKHLFLPRLFAFSLGIFLLYSSATYADQQVENSCSEKFVGSKCIDGLSQVLPELAQANIVYLGETHDNPEDHKNQLKIIQKLYKRNPKISIAMEMFQRPYQEVVNEYLAGKLTEKELIQKSEYQTRWGFHWQNYAPILKFAKEKQLPVIALNTPSEITRKVAREGLKTLTLSEQKFIPPLSEIHTDNEEYRQQLQAAFQQHHASNNGKNANVENFFQAQVLWDETMAEGIAKFVNTHPNYQIIVLAGQGHIIYGYGIPSPVARRLKAEKIIQRSVLLSPPNETQPKEKKAIADFILQGEKLP